VQEQSRNYAPAQGKVLVCEGRHGNWQSNTGNAPCRFGVSGNCGVGSATNAKRATHVRAHRCPGLGLATWSLGSAWTRL